MRELMHCIQASTGIRKEPKPSGSLETELLFGEQFEVEDVLDNGWAFGRSSVDGYPGYVYLSDLGTLRKPTHWVSERDAVVYLKPDFKSYRLRNLAMNSLVHVVDEVQTSEGLMCGLENAGWVFKDQLLPIGEYADDFVAQALKFSGTSYLWGAKSFQIDCSALLQAACQACDIKVPRDCIPQSKVVGDPVDFDETFSNLQRGDLVFWTEGKGRHVVIMTDSVHCVHASIAPPRRVVMQPLAEVVRDQARDGNGRPTMVRRLSN